MPGSDLTKLSNDELMARWDKAAEDLTKAREQAKTYSAEVERRQVAAEAIARIETLSDAERSALTQALGVVGVPSAEVVGG